MSDPQQPRRTTLFWPNRSLLELLDIKLPIIQAPLAGANGSAMAIGASRAGALGSLPCAMLDATAADNEVTSIAQAAGNIFNLNFFCHTAPQADAVRDTRWRETLARYYTELDLDPDAVATAAQRNPFNEAMCALVERHQPRVVSFHFGLPQAQLLARVKAAGCLVTGSATTVVEASWLQDNGCDFVIAQGYQAGGHRGNFLTDDMASQPGLLALLPQVVDAVSVPVVAAGGIADGRAIAAAFALGAAGVQIGSAYLFTSDSLISPAHREALDSAADDATALTNLFSGRPARGLYNRLMRDIGPMSSVAPEFPNAGTALAPLKKASEANGQADFSSLWSGQAAALSRTASGISSEELTQRLARDAQNVFGAMTVPQGD